MFVHLFRTLDPYPLDNDVNKPSRLLVRNLRASPANKK